MIKNIKQIAVLLATYNGEKYLETQLDSLVNQTSNDFKVYIHDDGSKDNTVNIINQYVERYPNLFEFIGSHSTGGPMNNFMYLLSNVNSNYYMFCDQDDYWYNFKIEKTYDAMLQQETNEDVPVLICTDVELVDHNLDILYKSYFSYKMIDYKDTTVRHLLKSNFVIGCTVMINNCLKKLSLEKVDLKNIYMHDWWFALIASQFGCVNALPISTIKYRQHEQNASGSSLKGNFYALLTQMIHFKESIQVKKDVKNIRVNFAKELLKYLDVNDRNFDLINELSNFHSYSKIKRIKIYSKYDLYSYSSNIIWEKIWI